MNMSVNMNMNMWASPKTMCNMEDPSARASRQMEHHQVPLLAPNSRESTHDIAGDI